MEEFLRINSVSIWAKNMRHILQHSTQEILVGIAMSVKYK